MSRQEHTRTIFAHGITPARIDRRYRFASLSNPAEFFLLDGVLQMRFTIDNRNSEGEELDLLVLCVHDQDPVGNAEALSRWTYAESYDLEGGIHHLWWLLTPAARSVATKPAS